MILIKLILAATFGFSAIPKPDLTPQVREILISNPSVRNDKLKKLGSKAYPVLVGMAFHDAETMKSRWSAFMALVQMAEKESLPEVRKALVSKDWFLRDAGLRVLPVLDAKAALTESTKALKDPALIVRTTAVENLKKIKDPNSAAALWSSLYDKRNFHRKQSLWIRRHILEALAEISPKGSAHQFGKVLNDNDKSLLEPAMAGLEKVTKQKLGDPHFPLEYRRQLWLEWTSKNL